MEPPRPWADAERREKMAHCAQCQGKYCKEGDLTKAPKDCPSAGVSHQTTLGRYSQEELEWSRQGVRVEGNNFPRNTRIEEIMDYAQRLGYHKLGLAFCVGLSEEAATVSRVFRANGFAVESVCCKNGAVLKTELGFSPQEKGIRPGMMCNPVGQAAVLDEAGCDFNVLLGLCVGHDTLFIRHSQAPVTVLAVKDRATGHNPLAPVYCADGYFKRVYGFLKK